MDTFTSVRRSALVQCMTSLFPLFLPSVLNALLVEQHPRAPNFLEPLRGFLRPLYLKRHGTLTAGTHTYSSRSGVFSFAPYGSPATTQ